MENKSKWYIRVNRSMTKEIIIIVKFFSVEGKRPLHISTTPGIVCLFFQKNGGRPLLFLIKMPLSH